MDNFLPLSHRDACRLYKAIRSVPYYIQHKCPNCFTESRCSGLQIYWECPNCNYCIKVRALSSITDTQDIMLVVLKWLSETGHEVPKDLASFTNDDWQEWDEYFSSSNE